MAKAKVKQAVVEAVSTALASPFKALAEAGERVEAVAITLLREIKRMGIVDVAGFDAAYAAACAANGWNTRPGRPAKDRRAVPHTVRTYAWEIRSALRVDVNVGACRSMHEVRLKRAAEKEARAPVEPAEGVMAQALDLPPEVQQDLEGVRILAPNQPNGALWHDAIALFIRLPDEQRATYGRQVNRLVHRYQAGTPTASAAPVRRSA